MIQIYLGEQVERSTCSKSTIVATNLKGDRNFVNIFFIKAVYSVFLDHVWLRFAVLLIVVLFKHRYEVLSEEEAGEEVYEVPIIQVS